jgi:uncharacterized membrane protein YqjE
MIFDQVSNQIRGVVSQEVASAKAEVAERAKRNGVGIALIACAAALIGLALAALTLGAIAALATTFALWLSALIVGLVYILAAVGLAVAGKAQVKKGGAPLPTDTIHGLKDDVRKARANGSSSETPAPVA